MAISMGSTGADEPMMEMNTTPLIDVLLVLLIMFIITIPPITNAVNIDLPVDSGDPPPDNPVEPVINKVVILPTNEIQWNGTPVTLAQMEQFLIQTKSMVPEPELQFQPAPNAIYDTVDRALAKIKGSGITKFGFVGNEQYRVFGKADIKPN